MDGGFGETLDVGCVDDDACADVIVGSPRMDVGSHPDAGVVVVLFGSVDGLGRGRPALVISDDDPAVPGSARNGDHFGASVALQVGFVGAQPEALAIGAPGRDVDGVRAAGAVTMAVLASDGSLQPDRVQSITQALPTLNATPEERDHFGAAVALNIVYGLPVTLVVGTPDESIGDAAHAGVVQMFWGRWRTGRPIHATTWTERRLDVGERIEPGDAFGAALAVGNSCCSGFYYLSIGAPGEDFEHADSGRVFAITWDPGGDIYRIDTVDRGVDVSGRPQRGDHFGAALVELDYSVTDLVEELAIGAPGQDVDHIKNAGSVSIYRLETPLDEPGPVLTEATPGVPGDPQPNDRFGAVLSPRPYSSSESLGAVLAGLPTDGDYLGGAVLIVLIARAGGDRPDPVVWLPGHDGLPPNGTAFGTSVAGTHGARV